MADLVPKSVLLFCVVISIIFITCQASTSHKACTTDGKECVFPFTYLGKQYTKCLPGSRGSWCGTENETDGGYWSATWGYCAAECPTTTTASTTSTIATTTTVSTTTTVAASTSAEVTATSGRFTSTPSTAAATEAQTTTTTIPATTPSTLATSLQDVNSSSKQVRKAATTSTEPGTSTTEPQSTSAKAAPTTTSTTRPVQTTSAMSTTEQQVVADGTRCTVQGYRCLSVCKMYEPHGETGFTWCRLTTNLSSTIKGVDWGRCAPSCPVGGPLLITTKGSSVNLSVTASTSPSPPPAVDSQPAASVSLKTTPPTERATRKPSTPQSTTTDHAKSVVRTTKKPRSGRIEEAASSVAPANDSPTTNSGVDRDMKVFEGVQNAPLRKTSYQADVTTSSSSAPSGAGGSTMTAVVVSVILFIIVLLALAAFVVLKRRRKRAAEDEELANKSSALPLVEKAQPAAKQTEVTTPLMNSTSSDENTSSDATASKTSVTVQYASTGGDSGFGSRIDFPQT